MKTHRFFLMPLMLFLLVIVVSLGLSTNSQALTPQEQNMMHDAKSRGLIGEQLNGYLGVVTSSPSSEVKALVDKTNAERKALYKSIASRNSLKLEDVESLAGKKAVKKTKAGQYIQQSNGQWGKK